MELKKINIAEELEKKESKYCIKLSLDTSEFKTELEKIRTDTEEFNKMLERTNELLEKAKKLAPTVTYSIDDIVGILAGNPSGDAEFPNIFDGMVQDGLKLPPERKD